MIRGLISIFSPSYPRVIIYMLQSTEYQVGPYLAWWWRTDNFKQVAKRRSLDMTRRAGLLLYCLRLGMLLQVLVGVFVAYRGFNTENIFLVAVGASIAVLYPIIWPHLIVAPLLLARLLITGPAERRLIQESKTIFANHPAIIIAVAGSYGKTTVKELLGTILKEGKKVAITPANKNVAVSHAVFARKLTGDEDVLVIEYGEGRPGDVARFSSTTRPNIGIITGLAPAHLDQYKTLDAAAKDILSLAKAVQPENTYVNADSLPLQKYLRPALRQYNAQGVLGWRVSDITIMPNGMTFTMKKNKQVLRLETGLVGRHLVGPLALCVALADQLGLNKEQIEAGVAKTVPFEHRMEPRTLAGAWIIDDTYNGNLEGIRAGLELLGDLTAKRKIYVTPGLVDQGPEAEAVHTTIGKLIAEANPDKVVLMQNSVTNWISSAMEQNGFKGELSIQQDPLYFYTNLEHFVAAGDVVLMQNDWTDNYN